VIAGLQVYLFRPISNEWGSLPQFVALPAPRGLLARRHLPCASNAQGEGEQTALVL
jgi:hypothetical protein